MGKTSVQLGTVYMYELGGKGEDKNPYTLILGKASYSDTEEGLILTVSLYHPDIYDSISAK